MRRLGPGVMVFLALVAAACSGNGDVIELDEAAPEQLVTTSSSSTSTMTTTSTTEQPAVDPSADTEAAVIETWTSLLTAAASGSPDDAEMGVIDSLGAPETVQQLLAPLFPPSEAREIEFFPALTAQEDGTFAIDDCLVMTRGISDGASNWLVGSAEPASDSPTGWRITEVNVINLDPCVPRSIAEAAIEGYEAYWDAFDTIFDPAATNGAELLDETTTGPYRVFAGELVDRLSADGQLIRGRPETAPEFFEISSTTDLVIIDCQRIDPDLGVYVAATGERTDVIAPTRDGQTDVREATMELESGTWKVADLNGVVDVECGAPDPLPKLQVSGG